MGKRVFVTNLDGNVSASDLRQLFGAFGEVGSVGLVRDPTTLASRGCAVVEMVTEESAAACTTQLSGRIIAGRALKLKVVDRPAAASRRERASISFASSVSGAVRRGNARAAAERLFQPSVNAHA